jgi:hypothetical protein
MIITDAKGKPLEKPKRADYGSDAEYSRAVATYNDAVRKAGSEGFDRGFRAAMKPGKKSAEKPQREPDDEATRKAKVAAMMKTWAVKGR